MINQLNWHKDVLSLETSSLKELVSQGQNKIRKSLPFLDYGLIEHIRELNIKGVYGYLIQFVDIDEDISFAY